MKLRPHQKMIVEEVQASIMFGERNIMVDAFPAIGKSFIMSTLAKNFEEDGVIILVNISALVDQIAKHLDEVGVKYSILKADYKEHFDSNCKIQIVMAHTLHSRIKKNSNVFKNSFKYILIDEAHRENKLVSKRTKDIFNYLKPKAEIGFSGTPYTSEGFKFPNYEYMNVIGPKELEEKGWLCPMEYYVPKWSQSIDYSSVKIEKGDYKASELKDIQDKENFNNKAIESMIKIGIKDHKALVFCVNTEQADYIAEELKKREVKAESYHSKVKNAENILKAFIGNADYIETLDEKSLFDDDEDKYKITTLVSVSKIGIGFDCPDVDLIINLRPCRTRALYIQQLARGIRLHPKKKVSKYLDLAQTAELHGFHTDEYYAVEKPDDENELKRVKQEIIEKNSCRYITAFADNNLKEPINRDKYEIKIKELKKKEREDLHKLHVKDLAAIFETSEDHKTIITIACIIYTLKWGRPVSKAGYEYDYKPSNFWSASTYGKNPDFHVHHDMQWYYDQYPDHKKRWNKALRTKLRKIIKEGSGLYRITGFIKFLYEKRKEEEESFMNVYEENKEEESITFEKYNLPKIDVDENEIPF